MVSLKQFEIKNIILAFKKYVGGRIMNKFLNSSMETVKKRIKKPAITAIAIMVMLLIQETFIRHTLGHFLTKELFGAIGFCFMMGGLWYGKNIVAEFGRRPVDIDDEEEEYRPENGTLTAFRWGLAVVIGGTVGAVYFAIDALRIIYMKVKAMADKK